MCLVLSWPVGQFHSSERARLGCYNQLLIRFGQDVETLDDGGTG